MSTTADRRQSLRDPAIVGLAGVGAAALLHFRDPHQSGSYGFCPFQLLTGLPCPGCGGLRAVNDLSRGDLVGALGSNLLAVVLVVVLAVAWVRWVVQRSRGVPGRMFVLSTRSAVVVGGVFAVFGVVRLTPWGSWLAP